MTYQGRAQRRSWLSRPSMTERMDCRGAQRRRVYTRRSPQIAFIPRAGRLPPR